MSSEYSANCPKNCPPSTATSAAGTLYRAVSNDPPQASDFVSHTDAGEPVHSDPCGSCALSFFTSAALVRSAIGHSNRLRKRGCTVVAVGTLTEDIGVMDAAHRGHHNVWVRTSQAATIHSCFQKAG